MATPFWQTKNPVAAYLVAFQKFVGVPQSGRWDAASHAALYKLVHKFKPEVSSDVAWGTEPEKTVEYVLALVQDTDDPVGFAAMRTFLSNLGYPIMSFEEAQRWVENLSDEEAKAIEDALKAVAEAVGRAESGPMPASDALPPSNGAPPNGAPPNGAPVPSNGAPAPPNGTPPSNGAPPPPNGGMPPNGGGALATAGMKTGTKIAIGVGVAAGALLLGWLAYRAFKKPEGGGPPTAGCNCG